MKKYVFVLIILVLALSAFAKTPTVTATPMLVPISSNTPTVMATLAPTLTPTPASEVISAWPSYGTATLQPTLKPGEPINMRQLYEKYFSRVGSGYPEYWVGTAYMEIVEPYIEGSLEVIINGNRETIIDDSECEDCSRMYFHNGSRVLGTNEVVFEEYNLFSVDWYNLYNSMFISEIKNFYIFPAAYLSTGLAIIPEPEMPKIVDPSTWDGTKTALMEWKHPNGFIVNLQTGETTGPGFSVLAIDDNHHQTYFYGNSRMWGFLHVEQSRFGEWKNIILTESEPDPEVYKRTRSYFEENFPDETYIGPYDTCEFLEYKEYNLEESEMTSEEEMVALCDVFYSDGNSNNH